MNGQGKTNNKRSMKNRKIEISESFSIVKELSSLSINLSACKKEYIIAVEEGKGLKTFSLSKAEVEILKEWFDGHKY